MNKIFEVLVYTHEAENDCYGCPDIEKGFDTLEKAEEYYFNVRFYYGKELMKYDSLESDADGTPIHQDHKDDMETEKSFSVSKIDVLATCEVNLSEEDLMELNGLSDEEVNDQIKDHAVNSDMWRIIESEDNVSYEVDEN